MSNGDRYLKLVEWSDDDGCFIGSCPELFYGGSHGLDAPAVFDELCGMIEENILLYKQDQKALPTPMSGRDFVNALQRAG